MSDAAALYAVRYQSEGMTCYVTDSGGWAHVMPLAKAQKVQADVAGKKGNADLVPLAEVPEVLRRG